MKRKGCVAVDGGSTANSPEEMVVGHQGESDHVCKTTSSRRQKDWKHTFAGVCQLSVSPKGKQEDRVGTGPILSKRMGL